MALEFLGCTTQALPLASTPEAAMYEAHHNKDGAVLLMLFTSKDGREGVRRRLPPAGVRTYEAPESAIEARKWGLIVTGPARMAHFVTGLWEWGRSHATTPGGAPGAALEPCVHFSHKIAATLVSQEMKEMGGMRVGDKTLELMEVKGWGFFGIVLGARLGGAEGEDVAVKVFLGQGSQAAFEKELSNLQTLTTKISPAASVVRLVGEVEASEGGALPWPALVMTPLCVESLEQRIDRFAREPYTLDEALAWAVQVALSLHHLHRESRLRHGDVTLRNVLLGRDGRAYLADMGVAEHNHPYGRQPQQEGQGKCYSASVAPEMVDQGEERPSLSDASADVWSWGVLLHALLTRSTAMAKGDSISEYLSMMEGEQWWEEVVALWGAEELPEPAFQAVRHSLCELGNRVGLLAGVSLLGQAMGGGRRSRRRSASSRRLRSS
jgi:serine/threonine protein kinase